MQRIKTCFVALVTVLALCVIAYADLDNGLVAYYPFNGNANDESGNGLDGDVKKATLTNDRFGNTNSAYYFDGINNNIIELPSVELRNLLNGLSEFSVAAWFLNDGPGDQHRNILRWCDTGGDSRGLMFRIGASGSLSGHVNKFEVLLGTVGYQRQNIVSLTDIPTGIWTHLAVVYDGSKIWLFINGTAPEYVYMQGKITANGVSQTGAVTMGISPAYISAYNTENFNGIIDDIRSYDRALSASEIQELFFKMPSLPKDNQYPTGAIHAHYNMIWPPNNKMVKITIDGYVVDEYSMLRDGGGIGVLWAYAQVGEQKIILRDENIDLLGTDGQFSFDIEVRAKKGSLYPVELYAADTDPGKLNSGLVDSTLIHVPFKIGK